MTSGTNSTATPIDREGPAIILVRPQLSENIGTTARAMMNCALTDLRLVAPKEDWFSERAVAASSGSVEILEKAKVFATTAEALADLHRVYATTGRNRYMVKPVVTPRRAAAECHAHIAEGRKVGVMFGPERTGLENDDISLADTVINVPLNPVHASLNLAQAVLLIGYEWFQEGERPPDFALTKGAKEVATKDQLHRFFDHLEQELDGCGFFRAPGKRAGMVINIRNMFERADLTLQEVRTLHGIVTELATARRRKEWDLRDALKKEQGDG